VELLKKLRDVAVSVAPIIVLVLISHLFISPLSEGLLANFLISSVFVIIGLTLFLLGADIGVVPIGQRIGSAVTTRRSLLFLILTGLVVGFVITFAEPNAKVLASQVSLVDPSIQENNFLLMMSLGVGAFIALAFLRVVLHIKLRFVLTLGYLLVFVLAFLNEGDLISISFDSGGSATGSLAVPFVMALGIGSARVQSNAKESDSFGFVSLQCLGAIIAVLSMGLLFPSAQTSPEILYSYPVGNYMQLFGLLAYQVAVSMFPLVIVFLLFQVTILKMPRLQSIKTIVGVFYTYIGMVLFLLGGKAGFMPVGFELGNRLASLSLPLLIIFSLLLGLLVVIAEPSVWILIGQVETISNNRISKLVMLCFLALGVSFSVALAILRIVFGFPILWVLVPVYAFSLILLYVGLPLFGAIAFDSGGVASGPMAATFILPFAIGVSQYTGNDAFGVVGFISMAPLVTIQLLGLIYRAKLRKGGQNE